MCKGTGLEEEQIKQILRENKRLIKHFLNEELQANKRKYKALYKQSICVLKSILNTDHYVDVTNQSGDLIGRRPEPTIIKVKKEIATDIVEAVGVKESKKRSGPTKAQQKEMLKESQIREEKQERDNEIADILSGVGQ